MSATVDGPPSATGILCGFHLKFVFLEWKGKHKTLCGCHSCRLFSTTDDGNASFSLTHSMSQTYRARFSNVQPLFERTFVHFYLQSRAGPGNFISSVKIIAPTFSKRSHFVCAKGECMSSLTVCSRGSISDRTQNKLKRPEGHPRQLMP